MNGGKCIYIHTIYKSTYIYTNLHECVHVNFMETFGFPDRGWLLVASFLADHLLVCCRQTCSVWPRVVPKNATEQVRTRSLQK